MTQSSKTSPAFLGRTKNLFEVIAALPKKRQRLCCSGGVPAAEKPQPWGPGRYRRDAAAALARPTTSTFHRWKNARKSSAGTWIL